MFRRLGLAARGQNPRGIRAAMHPRWTARSPGHTVVSALPIVMFSLQFTSSRLRSSLPFGRIAMLFTSQGASPTRRLAALGAHAGLSTDRQAAVVSH